MAERPKHFNYRTAEAGSSDCCGGCDALELRKRCETCEESPCPVMDPRHKIGDDPCPYGNEGEYYYCALQDAEVLLGKVCDHVFSSRPTCLCDTEGG